MSFMAIEETTEQLLLCLLDVLLNPLILNWYFECQIKILSSLSFHFLAAIYVLFFYAADCFTELI